MSNTNKKYLCNILPNISRKVIAATGQKKFGPFALKNETRCIALFLEFLKSKDLLIT